MEMKDREKMTMGTSMEKKRTMMMKNKQVVLLGGREGKRRNQKHKLLRELKD